MAAALRGSTVLVTIPITRKDYVWEQKIDPKTGEVVWVARLKNDSDDSNASAPA